jgi:hypothetical protein
MSRPQNRPLMLRLGAWGYLGLALLLGVVAEVWVHSGATAEPDAADDISLYTQHVTQGQGAVSMRYAQLSAQMDEAALQAHFVGLGLVCQPAQAQSAKQECLAAPEQVDGVSALQLRLVLVDGGLTQATVLVPWWSHHAALRVLLRDLGAAQALSPEDDPHPSIAWRVPGGEVRLNRAPGFDPLRASSIVWRATARPAVPTSNPVTKSP